MTSFIVILWLIWRIFLFLASLLGGCLLSFAPRFPYSDIYLFPSKLPNWLYTFANFDGVHYLTITNVGYEAQYTQVFFPLYAIILRSIKTLIPALHPIIIGVSASSLFFLLSLFVFNKLLLLDYRKKEIKWILLFLVFFPTSFFFGSIYTESTFLLFCFLSFYFARKKSWFAASIFAALASLTRISGIFLLPALLWENYLDKVKGQKSKVKGFHPKRWKNVKCQIYSFIFNSLRSPILYIAPLGLFAYMLYLQVTFGDFLYFWHVQPVFGAERSGGSFILFPQVIFRYIKILLSIPLTKETFWISFLELTSFCLSVLFLIYAHLKKIRLSYLIFSWFSIIVPSLTGTFSSMPRYIMLAFPIYIILGKIDKKFIKYLTLCLFLILSFILTIIFTRGHWVS